MIKSGHFKWFNLMSVDCIERTSKSYKNSVCLSSNELISLTDNLMLNLFEEFKHDFALLSRPIEELNKLYLTKRANKGFRQELKKELKGKNPQEKDEIIYKKSKVFFKKLEQNPELLSNYGPAPFGNDDSKSHLSLEQLYAALYQKLENSLDTGKMFALSSMTNPFNWKERWEIRKLMPADHARVRKIFDIYFKAYFSQLPENNAINAKESYSYLNKISGEFFQGSPKDIFLINGNYTDESFLTTAFKDGVTVSCVFKFLLFLAATVVTVGAFPSLCYILDQCIQSIESIYHDENRLQASLILVSLLIGVTIGVALAIFVLPYWAPVLVGVVWAAVLISSLTCLLTALTYHYCNRPELDALSPMNPHLFKINERQMNNLLDNHYDIDTVKCVLAVLKSALDELKVTELPSPLRRFFSCDNKIEKVKQIIELARLIKEGTYSHPEDIFEFKGMRFHLKDITVANAVNKSFGSGLVS